MPSGEVEMKVTVLGCGSSGGVPLIGGIWGDCDPTNPRNCRTRTSILVEEGETAVLVDTSPDMRQQLLACGLKKLDAVVFTHAHADHSHGIDELRSINWLTQKPVDVFADAMTMVELNNKFSYIFHGAGTGNFHKPSVTPHEISGAFNIGPLSILPFFQNHGTIRSLGLRFSASAKELRRTVCPDPPNPLGEGGGDFAYSTDVHDFDDSAVTALRGIKTWVLDCVRAEPHPTHLNLPQALKWIETVKPERTYLTHLSHKMDYDTLTRTLPAGVLPAYDGLVIECG
jgi:phosphoribosyl 1,2-cyclic phosphate phosphodiesterase